MENSKNKNDYDITEYDRFMYYISYHYKYNGVVITPTEIKNKKNIPISSNGSLVKRFYKKFKLFSHLLILNSLVKLDQNRAIPTEKYIRLYTSFKSILSEFKELEEIIDQFISKLNQQRLNNLFRCNNYVLTYNTTSDINNDIRLLYSKSVNKDSNFNVYNIIKLVLCCELGILVNKKNGPRPDYNKIYDYLLNIDVNNTSEVNRISKEELVMTDTNNEFISELIKHLNNSDQTMNDIVGSNDPELIEHNKATFKYVAWSKTHVYVYSGTKIHKIRIEDGVV